MEIIKCSSFSTVEMKEMINKVVKVCYESNYVEGTVYTIDPISGMIALMVRDENTGRNSMHLILKPHITSVHIIGPSKYPVAFDLFDKRRLQVTEGEKVKRCDKLTNWLQLRKIPFTTEGDVIKVIDVAIHPPYQFQDCVSNNVITLEKIKQLLLGIDNSMATSTM